MTSVAPAPALSLSAGRMTSVAPSPAHLVEFGRITRCSISCAHNGNRRGNTSAARPRKSRTSQRAPAGASLKLNEEEEIAERPIYEDGIFDTNFSRGGTQEEKTSDPQGEGRIRGLVPEDWKYMQQDLHLTKVEKKKQFRMQEMENAQLNELRAQLRRQKTDLLSSTEQPPTDPSWTGRTQLLNHAQLLELERELLLKRGSKNALDKEFDEMFTMDEKQSLKRWRPDFSQAHCRKWPTLHMLAMSGQSFFLDQYLKLSVEVDDEDEEGYTPLQRAVQARKETAVSQLLHAGANVDVYDKDGASLLHLSVEVGSMPLVRLFLRRGVPVNGADQYGWTPLHVAVMTTRADIVRHLIVSGADRSSRTKDGFTPLDVAVALGKGLRSYSLAKCLKTLEKRELIA